MSGRMFLNHEDTNLINGLIHSEIQNMNRLLEGSRSVKCGPWLEEVGHQALSLMYHSCPGSLSVCHKIQKPQPTPQAPIAMCVGTLDRTLLL